MVRIKNKSLKIVKICIGIFLAISVIAPLIRLFATIQLEDIPKLVGSSQFGTMVLNSLLTTLIATVISVSAAWGLAWCINRSNIRGKAVFSVLFTLPMLIPSISHGMGLVLLFGDNGLITNLFGVHIGLYGYPGIIMGAFLYSFPVAFLMLTDVFRYEDYTVYEAADVLGLNSFQKFKRITFPNFKKALISVMFAVFTMIFTDYGVPFVVGGKVMTLPVYMYREVIGLLDFSKGSILGIILLLPAVVAFIFDLKSDKAVSESTVVKPFSVSENKLRDRISYIICIAVVVLICISPLTFAYLSFVKQFPIDMHLSFANIFNCFKLGVVGYLLNSLTVALLSSLVGVACIYLTAYCTARSKKTFSSMTLHLISMISLAIPGIVLGLSYVLFFKGTWLYGTLSILVLVNLVHFFASPYLLAYNSMSRFNNNLEDVAQVMGISRIRMLLDVYIPATKETMLEVFSYIFVNSMVTISAVSFLANFKNLPLSLLLPQLDAQSMIEATAFISVLILAVNCVMKVVIHLLKMHIRKQENEQTE